MVVDYRAASTVGPIRPMPGLDDSRSDRGRLKQRGSGTFHAINPTKAGKNSFTPRERLDAAIQEIRAYTSAHPDLLQSHHFVFDYPLDKSAGKPEVLVMGYNPGEVESQWLVAPRPTESTWNCDFQEVTKSRPSRNWHNNARFFSNDRPVVFTDLFFWSARDKTQFEQRYGLRLKSPTSVFVYP